MRCACLRAAELLNEAENSKPSSDAFEFAGGTVLERAGAYILRYVMTPSRPAAGMLKASMCFNVAPGPATEMILQVRQPCLRFQVFPLQTGCLDSLPSARPGCSGCGCRHAPAL